MLYIIENKDNCEIYKFNDIDLKIKSIEKKDNVWVYINYNGYNPLLAMFLGSFESECEMDSISFTVRKEDSKKDNTMYAVVNKEDLIGFIKEIYFFIMENNLDNKLHIRDKNVWSF